MNQIRTFSDHLSSSRPRQLSNWREKKEYFLNSSVKERRKNYACGDKFMTAENIDTWSNISQNIQKDPEYKSLLQGSIYKPNKKLNDKIGLFGGNIAALEIDVIVNAANNTLLGGGGVDAVIHKAAGPFMSRECTTLNGCETGQAKITGGYDLPAKYIIHTVGPVGENAMILESCYINSLNTAAENKLRTVAFPCISTGIYGYPNKGAAQVVLQTVRTFLEANHDDFDLIIFCLFLDIDKNMYTKFLPYYFPTQ